MKNKKIIFVFLIVLIVLIVLVSCSKRKTTIFIDNGEENIKVKAELADTVKKMEKGLMFRKSLDENEGMFFAFNEEAYYTLRMENMLIPADFIFISQDFDIVDIIYAEPCKEDPCEAYKSKIAGKYVLGVNSNFTIKNNIKIGNKVIIKEGVIEKMLKRLSKG